MKEMIENQIAEAKVYMFFLFVSLIIFFKYLFEKVDI